MYLNKSFKNDIIFTFPHSQNTVQFFKNSIFPLFRTESVLLFKSEKWGENNRLLKFIHVLPIHYAYKMINTIESLAWSYFFFHQTSDEQEMEFVLPITCNCMDTQYGKYLRVIIEKC